MRNLPRERPPVHTWVRAVSAGAIYRYFRSKEDIVAALRNLVGVSLGRLADPVEQRWRRVTVQVWGEALRSDCVLDIVRGGLDEPVPILADLFRRGHREGALPPALDPDGAARVCASIFQGLGRAHSGTDQGEP